MAAQSVKANFDGAAGLLSGVLELPQGRPRAFALFAHCFSCSKDMRAAREIARALRSEGYAVLRFDFAGLGGSGGDFSQTNFSTNVGDLLKAADYLRREFDAPEILIGHSLGGAAALVAALEIPEIKGVATIGAPAETAHVAHQFEDHVAEIRESGAAEVSLAGRPFVITRQFLDDLDTDRVTTAASRLKKPLLVLHAPLDESVSVANAQAIFTAAKHPKSFVSLDTADHLLSNPADARYAASVIAAWANRFLGEAMDREAGTAPSDDGAAHARIARGTAFGADVSVGGFSLRADIAQAEGGDASGPTPTQMLEAALAACSLMTLRMYAARKGWAVDGLEVAVGAASAAASGAREHGVERLEKSLTAPDGLDPAQRQRLLEIADRCPVHQMLAREIEIVSRLI